MAEDRRLVVRQELPTTLASCVDELASLEKERDRVLRKEQTALAAYETLKGERRELDRRHTKIKRKKRELEVASKEVIVTPTPLICQSALSIPPIFSHKTRLVPGRHRD